jgi:hypothetical protein
MFFKSLSTFAALLLVAVPLCVAQTKEQKEAEYRPLIALFIEIPHDGRPIWEYESDLWLSLAASDVIKIFGEITPEQFSETNEAKTGKVIVDNRPLPRCQKPDVRLIEVHFHSPGTDQLDVLYYEQGNENDREKVARYKDRKIEYPVQITVDRTTLEVDDWQLFSRRLDLHCLPTRFRFVFVGSRRYKEYREGDRAFDE